MYKRQDIDRSPACITHYIHTIQLYRLLQRLYMGCKKPDPIIILNCSILLNTVNSSQPVLHNKKRHLISVIQFIQGDPQAAGILSLIHI